MLSNTITKFEKTRVIGARAVQLSMNAPPLVDPGNEIDVLKIAEMEYNQKKIPFQIVRKLPSGESDVIPVASLMDTSSALQK